MFQNCTRLAKLELPNCTSFGFNAVTNCVSLEELNLPKQQTMWNHSYNRLIGCTSLKKVSLPIQYEINENTNNLFLDCVALEEVDVNSLKIIPSYFLANKHKLHTVKVGAAVWINKGAFEIYISLKNITINVTNGILKYAFNNCTSLTELNLPNVRQLGKKALANMDSQTTLTLGKSISIWDYSTINGSVCNCPALTTINVPDSWSIPAKGISFVNCPSISRDSVISMFNKLISNVGKVSKNIALDNAVLKGLTEAELKIAKNKNYNIVRLGEHKKPPPFRRSPRLPRKTILGVNLPTTRQISSQRRG